MRNQLPRDPLPWKTNGRGSLVRFLSFGVYALLLIFTFSNGLIFFFLWRYYSAQNQQQAEWNFAENLAPRISSFLSPEVDFEKLRGVLDSVLEANLEKDIYILNENGGIELQFSRTTSGRTPLHIFPEPIMRFLDQSGRRHAPLYGLDPNTGKDALFSVTPIALRSQPGFLYVILNNSYSRAVRERHLAQITIITILLSAFIAVFGALLLATFFFRPIRRRISSMMHTVRELGAGNRSARAKVTGKDELGELGAALNHMAEEIDDAVVQLESKDRLRRELIENIWHDIRGPVAALRGLADLLGADRPSSSLAQGISANAAHLSRFLDELRELSDLELKEKKVAQEAVDLLDLAEELIASLKHQASEESKHIRLLAADGLPLVRGDAHLLSRLLQNLIENALRYTAPGGEVSVSLREHAQQIELSVSDSGPGISEEILPKVFERKFQASEWSTLHGTAGLGLSIVKRIAEAHHAQLLVENMDGKGARFIVLFARYGETRRISVSSNESED